MTQTHRNTKRRMARPADSACEIPKPAKQPSKLDKLQSLLMRDAGATLAEMAAVTGWQPHSLRGAMAGALRKRGLSIMSNKHDGDRRYQASAGE